MHVGILSLFQQFAYGDMTDSQVYQEELGLALQAETLGFDSLWCVEHHFEDYSFCPDNMMLLTHVAAKTERIKLGTGAVILPWNDPLRVAERIALLDELSGGRVIFGIGRGLSKREYDQFGIDMGTSRERFDEAAAMILEALESGVIQGNGKHYSQPPAKIRPKPSRSFAGRTTSVAMSPESAQQAAKLGVQMMTFAQKDPEAHEADFELYRTAFRQHHSVEPPPPLITNHSICHEDADCAEELARKYIPAYMASVMEHYDLMGDHFAKAGGYASYAEQAVAMRDQGLDGVVDGYLNSQIWGTPDQILEKIAQRQKIYGTFELLACFRFAGLPYADAEHSMRLFSEKVMPHLHT